MNEIQCPFCSNDNPSLIEVKDRKINSESYLCIVCSKDWRVEIPVIPVPTMTGKKVA